MVPMPPVSELSWGADFSLRAMVRALPGVLLLFDRNGLILAASGGAEAFFDYSADELIGKEIETLLPEFRRRGHSEAAKSHAEFTAISRHGTAIPVEVRLGILDGASGDPFLVTITDLSARKELEISLKHSRLEMERLRDMLAEKSVKLGHSEENLRNNREKFRYLFERNPLPMWLYSQETLRFLEVNEAALNRYGYTREEFLSMTLQDIRPEGEMERLRKNLGSVDRDSYQRSRNWRHLTKDGKLIEVDIFSHAVVYEGAPARMVVALDVTERNTTEAQLRRSQKMDAIGQLTGGIAHDFNNLLMIILGNLEGIADEAADNHRIREMVDDALSSVARGAGLTRRMLAYARQQSLEARIVDLRSQVSEMADLLARSLGEEIRVEQRLPDDLWKTRVDPSQLESAILNLVVNARDAMPHGGTIILSARNHTMDATEALVHELPAGDYIVLDVKDTGIGISREDLEHVLEPFFTTKPVNKGTGLGLSMVYGFAKQSGGQLGITSELGSGTVVSLYLPRVHEQTETTVAEPPASGLVHSGPRKTVLLVEDDSSIRKMLERLLNHMGYEAFAAEDGPSAMALYERLGEIDMLISDVVLPNGMSGVEIGAQITAKQPTIPVIYMSGYTRNELNQSALNDEKIFLLQKPFRREDLTRAIQLVTSSATKRA